MFTYKDILEQIQDVLENDNLKYYDEIHENGFNSNSVYNLDIEIHDFDAFEVIGDIIEYEKFNFGEVFTDVSCKENVLNMYWYICGNDVVWEMFNSVELDCNDEVNEENTNKLLKWIEEELQNDCTFIFEPTY